MRSRSCIHGTEIALPQSCRLPPWPKFSRGPHTRDCSPRQRQSHPLAPPHSADSESGRELPSKTCAKYDGARLREASRTIESKTTTLEGDEERSGTPAHVIVNPPRQAFAILLRHVQSPPFKAPQRLTHCVPRPVLHLNPLRDRS